MFYGAEAFGSRSLLEGQHEPGYMVGSHDLLRSTPLHEHMHRLHYEFELTDALLGTSLSTELFGILAKHVDAAAPGPRNFQEMVERLKIAGLSEYASTDALEAIAEAGTAHGLAQDQGGPLA